MLRLADATLDGQTHVPTFPTSSVANHQCHFWTGRVQERPDISTQIVYMHGTGLNSVSLNSENVVWRGEYPWYVLHVSWSFVYNMCHVPCYCMPVYWAGHGACRAQACWLFNNTLRPNVQKERWRFRAFLNYDRDVALKILSLEEAGLRVQCLV